MKIARGADEEGLSARGFVPTLPSGVWPAQGRRMAGDVSD